MSHPVRSQDGRSLAGERVAFLGRLAGMPRREAQRLIRDRGGVGLETLDATATLIVIGDEQRTLSSLGSLGKSAGLDEATLNALDRAKIEVIRETDLWRRLGLIEADENIQRLYTPAMLADVLKIDVAVIRRWQRRGLIRPVRQVRKLPYFDFSQVLVARRLADLTACAVSQTKLEQRLAEWSAIDADNNRTLSDFAVVSDGRSLLWRRGNDLLDAGGQCFFSFVAADSACDQSAAHSSVDANPILPLDAAHRACAVSSELLIQTAEQLEAEGELAQAADLYRAALAAGPASAETCFALAEVLYRLGDLSAARERYFMAIELDENYVEARANLGCLLAELGQLDLAKAAFEGALRYHPDYADAHYHLARVLHELDRKREALPHWQAFVRLAPDSPWAAEARLLLELADCGEENIGSSS
jgi:tetratricopeptide (TPR) repeat protein